MLQWVHSLVAVVIVYAALAWQPGGPLQWVHSLVAVVIRQQALVATTRIGASMGPQSGSCGYRALDRLHPVRRQASMGPQSGSCGYRALDRLPPVRRQASMGPQSGSCGYNVAVGVNAQRQCFNGSTV